MSTKYYCVSGFKPSWLFLYIFNRVYCIHVSGHDPLILSFRFLFLFDWVGVLCPQLSKVLKPVCWASLFPQCPCRGRLFVSAAGVHVFISEESRHCFLVGWCTNKSYVIATSDLWLFLHASNLLPSLPRTTPLHIYFFFKHLILGPTPHSLSCNTLTDITGKHTALCTCNPFLGLVLWWTSVSHYVMLWKTHRILIWLGSLVKVGFTKWHYN